MKNLGRTFFIAAAVILVWAWGGYFYFRLPEGSLFRDSMDAAGKLISGSSYVSERLLKLSDPLVSFAIRWIYGGSANYFSADEISVLKQSLAQTTSEGKLPKDNAERLRDIWEKVNSQGVWLPESDGSRVWIEAAGELSRLKKESGRLMTEMEKHRVSAVITVDPVDSNIWHIDFHDEVIFPVSLADVKVISATESKIYITNEDGIERRSLENLSPLRLSGEVKDILDIQFTFRNMISQTLFAPRAVRFIDANDRN